MQPNDNEQVPHSVSGEFVVSNLDKHLPMYWIKWKDSEHYYFQCDSMKEYIKKRMSLIGFPKLTKHFEYSHELTT